MNKMKELEKLSPELYTDVCQIIDGTQLSWTHVRSLLVINDELKRKFYLQKGRSPKIFVANGYNNDMEGRSPKIFVANGYNNDMKGRSPKIFVARSNNNLKGA